MSLSKNVKSPVIECITKLKNVASPLCVLVEAMRGLFSVAILLSHVAAEAEAWRKQFQHMGHMGACCSLPSGPSCKVSTSFAACSIMSFDELHESIGSCLGSFSGWAGCFQNL